MLTITEKIDPFPTYHEALAYAPSDCLFFDIETTGFSAASSTLFLIGAIRYEQGEWLLTQWLAEEPADESAVLRSFLELTRTRKTLIHFNGQTFDLPYIKAKASALGLSHTLQEMDALDLYQKFRSLKKLLGLERMNQTSLEARIGWQRTDRLTGKHMVSLFQKYAASKEPGLRDLLLQHNHDDMLGMTKLLSCTAYLLLFSGDIASAYADAPMYDDVRAHNIPESPTEPPATSDCAGTTATANGSGLPIPADHVSPSTHAQTQELSRFSVKKQPEGAASAVPATDDNSVIPWPISFTLKEPVPAPLRLEAPYSLTVSQKTGILAVPAYFGTLKYFFPDYKNYYYLPLEDQAIHKSVASFVDKAYRTPAKPDTCYTRKTGLFLPQPEALFTPIFLPDLHSPVKYFPWSDTLISDSNTLMVYTRALLTSFFPINHT